MNDDDGAYCDKAKAHPRAVELMAEDFFWNAVHDNTPFGSDEGFESYYCWRDWRSSNPDASLSDAIIWILGGTYEDFLSLAKDPDPGQAFNNSAFVVDWDLWTLNITIVTTALSQLLDEGTIDGAIKPFVHAATTIERSLFIENPGFMPAEVLDAIDRVVAAA